MLWKLQRKGHKCSFIDRYRQRVQAQGASHEQRWRHGVQRGWKGTLSCGSVPFFTGRFHTAFKHFFELGRSHRFHFDLLHLHLLLLHLLLLPSLSCLLKTQQKRGFTLSCSMFAKQAHSHSRPWSHFRPPYDAASLGPPHSWSSLSQPSSSPPGGSGPPPGAERASVSGSSPPRELGSCRPSVCPERRQDKINMLPHLRIMEERGRRNEVSFIRDAEGCLPLCWDGASWLYRCCRSPCSWGGAESPCPWETCCPCRALHTKTSRTFNSVGSWGRIYREKVGIVTIKCKQQRLLGLRQL